MNIASPFSHHLKKLGIKFIV